MPARTTRTSSAGTAKRAARAITEPPTTAPDAVLMVNVDGAAKVLGVSVHTVRREIWKGNLASRRVGGQIRVLCTELDRYLGLPRGTTTEQLTAAARAANGKGKPRARKSTNATKGVRKATRR